MMNYLLFSAIAGVCIAGTALVLKRYGPGRRCGKGAARNALREMYGRYWSEVRALTQRRMLNAASDEEWLAGIRAQAAASTRPAPRRLRLVGASRSVNDQGILAKATLFGLILDFRQMKLQAKSAMMPAQARPEMHQSILGLLVDEG